MSQAIDILNPEELTRLAGMLTEDSPPHVKAWFATTWVKWLTKQEHLFTRVLPESRRPEAEFLLASSIRSIFERDLRVHFADIFAGSDALGNEDEDEDDEYDGLGDEDEEPEDYDHPLPPAAVRQRQRMHRRNLRAPGHSGRREAAIRSLLDHPDLEESIRSLIADDKKPLPDDFHEEPGVGILKAVAKALTTGLRVNVRFIPETDLPAWAFTKLMAGMPVYMVVPALASSRIAMALWKHVRDYANTLPERQIRHTVDAMIKAVADWDEQLKRQKEIADLEKGTKLIADLGGGWKVVHFVEKDAFEAEGSVMKHCIKTYANRQDCMIYSLRLEGIPKFTLEVNKRYRCVVQGRGKHNSSPTPEIVKLVDDWAASLRYSVAEDAYVKDRNLVEDEDGEVIDLDIEQGDFDEAIGEIATQPEEEEGEDEEEPPPPPRRTVRRNPGFFVGRNGGYDATDI